MCFSASASFTASAALLLCSFFTLKKAAKTQRMLAAIPLLFAIQQFFEGMTWRLLADNQDASWYSYGYLIFVYAIWPLWIPISVRSLAPNAKERSLLRLPIAAGFIVTLTTLWYIGSVEISSTIMCNHIYYSAPIGQSVITLITICYLIATIAPFFILTKKYARLMGTLLAASYIATYYFYTAYIISIWCFCAALLSLLTFLMVG